MHRMSISVSSSLLPLTWRIETHTKNHLQFFWSLSQNSQFSLLYGDPYLFFFSGQQLIVSCCFKPQETLLWSCGARVYFLASLRLQPTPEELVFHQDPWKCGSLESPQEVSVPCMLWPWPWAPAFQLLYCWPTGICKHSATRVESAWGMRQTSSQGGAFQ